MASRNLTDGEKALAREIFGNNIDYDEVTINSHKYPPTLGFQPNDTVIAPNGNIYYPPGHYGYDADISQGTIAQKALFIHEMTHVLQDLSLIHI